MPDPHLHPDPAYLRAIAARDWPAAYVYLRSMRSAYVGARASALLRFVWRHVRQRLEASRRAQVADSDTPLQELGELHQSRYINAWKAGARRPHGRLATLRARGPGAVGQD